MSSMQYCYKPANETCQEKCLERCYGPKPNNGGSYYAGQISTALYGQSIPHACTDHNMAKPTVNHSAYNQPCGQPTTASPNLSHNSYGTQTYGHNVTAAKPVSTGHNHCMDKVHGHNHAGQQHCASHGVAKSCHENKSSHEKYCQKKGKSLSKKKYRDGNRSCGDSSGSDSD